jgi:hypothetical protein
MVPGGQRLYESLFIFHKCHLTIRNIWNLLDAGKENEQFVYNYGNILSNYIKLELLSMLEEYNKHFIVKKLPEFGQRVKEIREISKPVLKRINKWRGLTDFRNNIIAHTWRNDSGRMVLPDRHEYGVPANLVEVKILVDLCSYFWLLINAEFQNEVAEAIELFTSMKGKESTGLDLEGMNLDLLKMAEEVDLLCKQHGKKYYLKVDQYIIED